MNIKEWLEDGVWSSEPFQTALFWVRAMGLPLQYLTQTNAERVGAKVGLYKGMKVKKKKDIIRQGYLRFRVELPLNQAFPGGFFLNIPGNDFRWIQSKYKKLPTL